MNRYLSHLSLAPFQSIPMSLNVNLDNHLGQPPATLFRRTNFKPSPPASPLHIKENYKLKKQPCKTIVPAPRITHSLVTLPANSVSAATLAGPASREVVRTDRAMCVGDARRHALSRLSRLVSSYLAGQGCTHLTDANRPLLQKSRLDMPIIDWARY